MNLMKRIVQSSGRIRESWRAERSRKFMKLRTCDPGLGGEKVRTQKLLGTFHDHVLLVWRVEFQRPPRPANTSASRTQSVDFLLSKKPAMGKMGACPGISRFDSCVRGFPPSAQ